MLKASDDVRFNCSKQELYAQFNPRGAIDDNCDLIRVETYLVDLVDR